MMPTAAQNFGGQRQRTTPYHRERTAERGYGGRWQRYVRMYLRAHPVCAICRHEPATEVDHIIPATRGGDFWELSNHQPACKRCNSKKGART